MKRNSFVQFHVFLHHICGLWILNNPYCVVTCRDAVVLACKGMTRDLSSAERHGYPFLWEIRYCRDSEINIDGLPDYRMGELADVEEIEFFSDSGEESQTQCF